jgi:hypothetical protein
VTYSALVSTSDGANSSSAEQQLPASELFYGLISSLVLNFSLLISPGLLWIIPPSQKLCQQKLALEIPRMAIPHISYQNSKLSYEYFATVAPQDP